MSEFDDIDAIRDLITQVEAVEHDLMPNEIELFEELRGKYAAGSDTAVGFADKRCLEVILRNVLIRKQ